MSVWGNPSRERFRWEAVPTQDVPSTPLGEDSLRGSLYGTPVSARSSPTQIRRFGAARPAMLVGGAGAHNECLFARVRRPSRPHSVIGASGPASQALNGTGDGLDPTMRVGECFTGLRPVTSMSRHIAIGTGRRFPPTAPESTAIGSLSPHSTQRRLAVLRACRPLAAARAAGRR